MKVADYIVEFLASKGAEKVFVISGASDLRILDAFERHPKITYVCPHHEQAGVMAAITYTRLSGRPGIMMCTAGPGATNTITGIASAYLDSIPVLVIAGQEKSEFLDPRDCLRGKGVQGLDMVSTVTPLVKYAVCLKDPSLVRYELERCFYEMNSGRPGPVWFEVPQDIQSLEVNPSQLKGFTGPEQQSSSSQMNYYLEKAREVLDLIRNSERPLFWSGHGIRLSGAVDTYHEFLREFQIPTLLSWQAADLLDDKEPLYVGRAGTYGQRAANFVLQNCDLLIALGTRLAIPQRGYSEEEFARAAKKVIVEIDPTEIAKFKKKPDVVIEGDVKLFLKALLEIHRQSPSKKQFKTWIDRCHEWHHRYPKCTEDQRNSRKGEINSYHFIDRLSDHLLPSDVICTDMGTSLTCTHATIKIKKGQRLVTSTGLGEMGFGLPGAIGACLGSGMKRTVFIGAEGSLMMNLQELQTVSHLKLPLKIFILNNNSYLTIKHTERALFGERLSGCSPQTGVTFPDLGKVAQAFGIPYFKFNDVALMDEQIDKVLAHDGAVFCDVIMPTDQFLGPKSAVKTRPDGSLYSPPLEDLYPFLSREELRANMLIPLLPE